MEDLTSKYYLDRLMQQMELLRNSNDYEDACEYQRVVNKLQEAGMVAFNK